MDDATPMPADKTEEVKGRPEGQQVIADPPLIKQREGRGRPFTPGKSGNPAGRPKGSRGAALLALDKMGQGLAEELLTQIHYLAMSGDIAAASLLLRRVWPEPKGRPVSFDIPKLESHADLPGAIAALIQAVAAGELSPEEAQSVMILLDGWRRAVEASEIDQRLSALERNMAVKPQ